MLFYIKIQSIAFPIANTFSTFNYLTIEKNKKGRMRNSAWRLTELEKYHLLNDYLHYHNSPEFGYCYWKLVLLCHWSFSQYDIFTGMTVQNSCVALPLLCFFSYGKLLASISYLRFTELALTASLWGRMVHEDIASAGILLYIRKYFRLNM